jgi:poly-gamma-glutamate synthesis protein (capsule biosynthesis protein)
MRAVVGLVVAAVLLVGCNPDPTSGRPVPAGEPAPAFTSSIDAAGPGTPWPLASSWRPGCPVGPGDLRAVQVAHWGYDGSVRTGVVIVHASVAPAVRDVFARLYASRFQIERIEPVDAFGGSDAASMAANNTSAFNCRRVAGTTRWSEHAYGTAVDVNPVQNPYVRGGTVDPPAGSAWLDRVSATPGMIRDGDETVAAFAAGGFSWGGHWSSAKDHQHFSTTGR